MIKADVPAIDKFFLVKNHIAEVSYSNLGAPLSIVQMNLPSILYNLKESCNCFRCAAI